MAAQVDDAHAAAIDFVQPLEGFEVEFDLAEQGRRGMGADGVDAGRAVAAGAGIRHRRARRIDAGRTVFRGIGIFVADAHTRSNGGNDTKFAPIDDQGILS